MRYKNHTMVNMLKVLKNLVIWKIRSPLNLTELKVNGSSPCFRGKYLTVAAAAAASGP